MQKIIYTSPNKIDWDAQSAFKLTNYYTDKESCMVFCYLKQYVEKGSLKICTFCFDKEAAGRNDLQLCFNLNPENGTHFMQMEFGIDGIDSIKDVDDSTVSDVDMPVEGISFHSFTSNDQQGYYWCGEVTFSEDFIKNHFNTVLTEKSIIVLNLYKIFPGADDYACLFPDSENNLLGRDKYMREFVILNY